MKEINFNSFVLIICTVLLSVYLLPYFVNVENSCFLVHDNLNSNIVWYSRIANQKYLFAASDVQIPFMFNGIPRGCYPSQFNFFILLFTVFSPIVAYCINLIMLHIIAFIGSVLLIKKYFLKSNNNSYIYLISLCYTILPFWPSGQIGVAGMPLLLYAFMNLHFESNKKISWFIVLVFPFYSSFIFSNVFFIIFFSVAYLAYCLLQKERMKLQVIVALAFFVAISLAVEYRILYMNFYEHIVTHRSLYTGLASGNLNYFGWIGTSLLYFIYGQYHFYSYHYFILLLAIPAFILSENKYRIMIALILMFMLGVSFYATITDVAGLAWIAKLLSFKNTLQLRFVALFPLLSLILFSIIVKVLLSKKMKFAVYTVIIIQFFLVTFMFFPGDFNNDVYVESAFYNTYVSNKFEGKTFKKYYKSDLFTKVSEIVPPGDYNILVIGFESQIAQLSNYNTIDGYHYFYPVEKTFVMKEILKPYLDKNPLEKLFLVSRISISQVLTHKSKLIPQNLDLNFEILRANNCKYVFSTNALKDANISLLNVVRVGKNVLFIYELL